MRWITLFSLISVALGSSRICADPVITSSKLIKSPTGITFNQTTFECPDEQNNKPFQPLTDAEVAPISDARCTLPEPHCTCGIPCTGTRCFQPRGPIRAGDCSLLASALIVHNTTFRLSFGRGDGFSYGTCHYTVFNNEANNIQEYCSDTLGYLGLNQLNPTCPNQEANCGGGTVLGISRFFVEQIPASIG